jgi:hypothetical protein
MLIQNKGWDNLRFTFEKKGSKELKNKFPTAITEQNSTFDDSSNDSGKTSRF